MEDVQLIGHQVRLFMQQVLKKRVLAQSEDERKTKAFQKKHPRSNGRRKTTKNYWMQVIKVIALSFILSTLYLSNERER